MGFTESNIVEQMILDAATSFGSVAVSAVFREESALVWVGFLEEELKGGHGLAASIFERSGKLFLCSQDEPCDVNSIHKLQREC